MGVNFSNVDSKTKEHWSSNKTFQIHSRSRILKKINYELLWDNFLQSNAKSFAISSAEINALFEASLLDNYRYYL
jgi:hypothetical protein